MTVIRKMTVRELIVELLKIDDLDLPAEVHIDSADWGGGSWSDELGVTTALDITTYEPKFVKIVGLR